MFNQFRIKVKKTTIKDNTFESFTVQKRYLLIFWETASRKDISIEKSTSYPNWIAEFDSIEKAKNAIEIWKKNMANNVLKVKVLNPI